MCKEMDGSEKDTIDISFSITMISIASRLAANFDHSRSLKMVPFKSLGAVSYHITCVLRSLRLIIIKLK